MADVEFLYLFDYNKISDRAKVVSDLEKYKDDMLSSLNVSSQIPSKRSGGRIILFDFKNDNFELGTEYLLSKERERTPFFVSCENKKDYSRVEKILRKEYPNGKLSKGLFGITSLFGDRIIDYNL